MAYLIEGENFPVVYCANYRVGSTATADALFSMGGMQISAHHAGFGDPPRGSIIVQTVRNHFDVIASFYYKEGQCCPFEDYVNTILDGHHPALGPQDFYSYYGEWDYILSYDTLQFEFDNLCLFAGLPCTQIKQSKTTRLASNRWQNLFTTSLQDKVAERYSEELERIGHGVS